MIDDTLRNHIKWIDERSNTAVKSIENIKTYIEYNYKDRISMKNNSICIDDNPIDTNMLIAQINEEIYNDLGIKGQKTNIKIVVLAYANMNTIEDNSISINEKYKDDKEEIDNNLNELFNTIDNSEDTEWDKYKKWKEEDCMYIRDIKGNITGVDCCYNNLIEWINAFPLTKNKIRYNKTRQQSYFGVKPLDDITLHQVLQYINKYLTKKFSSLQSLRDALIGSSISNMYNELYDYFESLDINNGDDTDYIEICLKDVLKCEDLDKYYEVYYYSLLIELVASMKRTYYKELYEQPIKYDCVLTLCSSVGGSGKTTFFEKLYDIHGDGRSLCYVLAGNDFQPQDKDYIVQSHKYAMVLLDEIDMKRGLVNSIKGYITKRTDEFREAYAYFSKPVIRGFVMSATSNNTDFLKDYTTDNERRYTIIHISEDPNNAVNVVEWFDKKGLRDKLWTQIKRIYMNNPDIPLWLNTKKLQDQEMQIQSNYKFYQTDEDYKILDNILNFEYCMYKTNDIFKDNMLSGKDIVDQFKYGDSVKWAELKNEQLKEKMRSDKYIVDPNDREYDNHPMKIEYISSATRNEITRLMGLNCTPQGTKNHFMKTWKFGYMTKNKNTFYGMKRI